MAVGIHCFNAYFDWFYKGSSILIVLPLIIAIVFACIYLCGKDTYENRKKAVYAVVIFWVIVTIYCIWNIIYIMALYDEPAVNIGWGEPNTDPNNPEEGV